jgi:hypothetical protein
MFKIAYLHKYYDKPCFQMLGIDSGEAHRAKLGNDHGIENRFPLIEEGLDRNGCIKLIKRHGLPVPQKSGCYICPFQTVTEWKHLRKRHPDLFCQVEQLEKRNIEYRKSKGRKPMWISPKGSLRKVVSERQSQIWSVDEYPPCNCML